MDIELEGVLAVLMLIIIAAIPIKAGAHWVDAKRTDLTSCGIAAVVGVVVGHLATTYLGGAMGGPVAGFLGFIVAIRLVLGTSLGGALILSIIAIGIYTLATTLVVAS